MSLTVAEVATVTGLCRPAAYRIAHAIGQRVGGRFIVGTDRLRRFLAGELEGVVVEKIRRKPQRSTVVNDTQQVMATASEITQADPKP